MKPDIPVVDCMFSSSSSFVHLQNKQKQTFASDNYHVATTAVNLEQLLTKRRAPARALSLLGSIENFTPSSFSHVTRVFVNKL